MSSYWGVTFGRSSSSSSSSSIGDGRDRSPDNVDADDKRWWAENADFGPRARVKIIIAAPPPAAAAMGRQEEDQEEDDDNVDESNDVRTEEFATIEKRGTAAWGTAGSDEARRGWGGTPMPAEGLRSVAAPSTTRITPTYTLMATGKSCVFHTTKLVKSFNTTCSSRQTSNQVTSESSDILTS